MAKKNEESECTVLENGDKIESFGDETFFKIFQFLANWYVFPQERAERLQARILKALGNI